MLLSEMSDQHLENVISLIKKKAKNGLKLSIGSISTAEDMFYDEHVIYGKQVREFLNFKLYKNELKKRQQQDKKHQEKFDEQSWG